MEDSMLCMHNELHDGILCMHDGKLCMHDGKLCMHDGMLDATDVLEMLCTLSLTSLVPRLFLVEKRAWYWGGPEPFTSATSSFM